MLTSAPCSARSSACFSQKRASANPGEGARKCRVGPALHQPRRVVQHARAAQRLDQLQFTEIEVAELQVAGQQLGPLPALGIGVARTGTSTGPAIAGPAGNRRGRRRSGRGRARECCRDGSPRAGGWRRGRQPPQRRRGSPPPAPRSRARSGLPRGLGQHARLQHGEACIRTQALAGQARAVHGRGAGAPTACSRPKVRPSSSRAPAPSSSGALPGCSGKAAKRKPW